MSEHGVTPEIVRLFPTFVGKSRLEADARATVQGAILSKLGTLRAGLPDPEPGQVWQSRHGLHALPELAVLVHHIRLDVERILAVLHVEAARFEITGLWLNVAAPGGAVKMHNHPNNFLSGVYYLRTHAGANTINFHDPRSQAGIIRPPVTELTAENTDLVVVRVTDGTLLFFPAYLRHSVGVNASSEERISISFNIMFSAFTENLAKPLWSPGASS